MAIIYSYPLVSSLDSSNLFPLTATNEEDELYVANVTFSTLVSEIIDEAFNGTDRYIPRFDSVSSLVNSVIYEDSNSNVGIGTTSPSERLHVVGEGVFNSALSVHDPNVSSYGRLLLSHDSTGSSLYSNPASSNVSTVVLRLGINNSEKMRIANNGNVGIGTTAPSTKFHLQGGIARFDNVSSNYLEIDGSDSNNNHAIISNRFNQLQLKTNTGAGDPHIALLPATSGNVGIGTASPADKLHVGSGAIRLDNNYQLRWGGTETGIYGHSSQGLNLYTNSGSTRLKIDNGGNVGIGTTNPVSKLEVDDGDIEIDDSASGLILRSPDGTRYRVQVNNSGNLRTTEI